MKALFLLILASYLTLWHEMSRIKWKAVRINNKINLNYPNLQGNSIFDKIICISLKKKNDEFQYVYYAKRAMMSIAILLIPWFICVYLYDWYKIKQFLLVHLIISIFVGSAPTNILNVIFVMYEKKITAKEI